MEEFGSIVMYDLLDHCYIHGSGGAGPVYGFLHLVIHLGCAVCLLSG